MPIIAIRAQLLLVKRAASALDVPLPADFSQRVDAADRITQAAQKISNPDALNSTVLNALAEGRDYRTAPDVVHMLLDAYLVNQASIAETARARWESDVQAALVDHADEILTGWTQALDPHGRALLAAAEALPTPDLDDTRTIAEAGRKVLDHWANAQHAVKMWRQGVDGFMALAQANRITADRHNPAIITAADLQTLAPAVATSLRESAPLDVWTVARHGIPLRLATLGDYMERSASHDQQRRAIELAAAQRRDHDRVAALQ